MSLSYEMTGLDHLSPGVLSLRMPVANDAIQVGALHVPDEKERLAVMVKPRQIRLAREDGSLLQVDDVFYDETLSEHRRPVLVQAVAGLILCKEDDRAGFWSVDASEGRLRVYDTEALGRFVAVVAAFAGRSGVKQLLRHPSYPGRQIS